MIETLFLCRPIVANATCGDGVIDKEHYCRLKISTSFMNTWTSYMMMLRNVETLNSFFVSCSNTLSWEIAKNVSGWLVVASPASFSQVRARTSGMDRSDTNFWSQFIQQMGQWPLASCENLKEVQRFQLIKGCFKRPLSYYLVVYSHIKAGTKWSNDIWPLVKPR